MSRALIGKNGLSGKSLTENSVDSANGLEYNNIEIMYLLIMVIRFSTH
jgi:hypothetical protein